MDCPFQPRFRSVALDGLAGGGFSAKVVAFAYKKPL
jgi:hypothetical protein